MEVQSRMLYQYLIAMVCQEEREGSKWSFLRFWGLLLCRFCAFELLLDDFLQFHDLPVLQREVVSRPGQFRPLLLHLLGVLPHDHGHVLEDARKRLSEVLDLNKP